MHRRASTARPSGRARALEDGTPSRGRRATPTRAARSQARRLATAIRYRGLTRSALGAGLRDPRQAPHPWPRREHEHEPRVAQRAHRPALVGLEVREETAATGHAAAVLGHLDLAIAGVQVRALVDVMLL